jgi:hypothetical protein
VFLWYDDNDDHGVHRANTAQALTRWWLLGALHGATDTLHWAMCLTWYLPGGMVIAIAIDSDTFF